ncbi:MAG: hypothetical protein C0594_12795 [Marinilabiliales bacterium]|nr:MAG: hypothetical protein C0594_12795 [Marinilabiliales bacterium]
MFKITKIMKTKKIIITVISIVFSLSLLSCNKTNETIETTPEQQSDQKDEKAASDAVTVAKEETTTQFIFADVFNQVDKAVKETNGDLNGGSKSNKSGYPNFSITPFDLTSWPKTVTIDFGSQNYLCEDGIQRRGKIIVETSDWYANEDCITTISFDNYFVNNYKVEGLKTITNNGRNNAGNINYTVEVEDAIITSPDGYQNYWSSTRNHEWTAGESTVLNPYDDEYDVTGYANGTNSEGTEYTITIVEKLNYLVGCEHTRSGIIDIDIEGLPTITVDFGDGDCDPDATVTVFGVAYPFVAGGIL